MIVAGAEQKEGDLEIVISKGEKQTTTKETPKDQVLFTLKSRLKGGNGLSIKCCCEEYR